MGILVLTAMVAGAVVMPEPVGDPRTWFTLNDFPRDELRASHNGSIYFKAIANPTGRTESCIIEVSTLSANDKAAFCALVKSRFRYKKVPGQDTTPTYFVLEKLFFYTVSDAVNGPPMKAGPDFSIDVQRLPKALKGKIEVQVNVAVDAAGLLTKCDTPADAVQPALAKLACGQLPAIWDPMPEKNAAGEAIAYIRQMRVEFREAVAPAS
jgi:hypothetical protein